MSVVPGLPPPPTTHPASPVRNREMSGSPARGYAGSPTGAPYAGSPHGYAGSPDRFEEERMREEMRHREAAAHISQGLGYGATAQPQGMAYGSPAQAQGMTYGSPAQTGIAGYRSPRQYQPVNVGVPPSHPVYDSPVHQVAEAPQYATASYAATSPQYAGSPGHHVPSPGTPTQAVTSGEGESPRRIRAWGASGTLR